MLKRKLYEFKIKKKEFALRENIGRTICKSGTIKYLSTSRHNRASPQEYAEDGQLQAYLEKTSPDGSRVQFRMSGFSFHDNRTRSIIIGSSTKFDQHEYSAGNVLWDKVDDWYFCSLNS